jgi:hypothetical protein
VQCYEDIWGSGGTAPTFLTSALDVSKWSASRPGREIASGTHWIGFWVGLRTDVVAVESNRIYHVWRKTINPYYLQPVWIRSSGTLQLRIASVRSQRQVAPISFTMYAGLSLSIVMF